jgi:phytoene desaturase
MGKKIAVVGAGVGGLSAAARLAHDGHDVQVFEKLPQCGGRASLLAEKGFRIDMGPSFVLMPDFYREVFEYCGREIETYLDLKPLDSHYKIFYPDGEILNVYGDPERTKAELERLEPGAAQGYDAFIDETERIYRQVEPLLYQAFTIKDALNPKYWPLLAKLRVLQSVWDMSGRYFKTEKLRYAFTFEAMFIGVSPFQAPAFYSIITYSDQVQKVYHPMGGMYQIPLALERLAREFGAEFSYDAEVQGITKPEDKLLLDFDRGHVEAENVVVNADLAYAQSELLGRRLPNWKYSCSVYLLYWGLDRKVPRLQHHNLFFGQDLEQNLKDIFDRKVIPDDPSFYIHVPTVTDVSLAPPGKEILYVLIPVPNLRDSKEDVREQEARLRQRVIAKVEAVTGVNVEPSIELERRFYPQDFIRRYNIKYGATFGLSHNLWQSAFFRPANMDRRYDGLYYTGASTQPGGGLPVVMASSRIVADLIKQEV